MQQYLYRCHDSMDTNHTVYVCIHRYKVIKETEKGFWVQADGWTEKKWVSKTARKRYAYPTIEEAVVSFQHRKQRMLVICRHQIDHAQLALAVPREKYMTAFGEFY